MFAWKKWLKVLVIIPITIIFSAYKFISEPIDITVGNLLLSTVMGQTSTENTTAFLFVVEKLFYLVIFNIMYGNFIYDDFRYSSVYLFSRLKSRSTWFYKKSLELLGITFVYTGLFLITNFFICKNCTLSPIEQSDIIILFLLFARIIMLLFLTTVAINLISIRLGNALGFIIVYISVVLLVFVAMNQSSLPYIGTSKWLLIFNPACGIIEDIYYDTNLLVVFFIYNIILVCIAMMIGSLYIDRFDVALVDYENE